MRSANAPLISAGVMTAKNSWKPAKASCGMVEPADQVALVGAERERVADQHPQHRHHAEGEEAVHHGAEHVFRPDHAAVEQRQTRRHEHHQGGGDQYEGGIAGIQDRILLGKCRPCPVPMRHQGTEVTDLCFLRVS
jgi:hypothetical protein